MIKFYKVGGCVRDQFLGRKSKDIDFAVEAPSYEVMANEIASRGEIFLEQPEYFTIRAKIPELGAADFVLCRKESHYTDGRHPENVTIGTLMDDLSRRDFRANAIAIAENGEIIDPFNGQTDIANRLINTVGNPLDRFDEDRLRILRAFRFSIQLDFRIYFDVIDAIYEISCRDEEIFKGVSTDRIRDELHKMFFASTVKTLDLFQKHPKITAEIFRDRNIWLKPTSESNPNIQK